MRLSSGDEIAPRSQSTATLQGLYSIAPAQNGHAVYISHVPHSQPEDEVWHFRQDPEGYAIASLRDIGEVLSLAGQDAVPDSPVVQSADIGAKWQRWKLVPEGDEWRIASAYNQQILDYQVPNPDKAASVIHTNSSTNTQIWQLKVATAPQSLTVFARFRLG